MLIRDSCCSFGGTEHPEPLASPRTCPGCSTQVGANPISVVLVPVVSVFGPQGLAEMIAFPLHVEAAHRSFADRGITGPHAFAAS